jgi:hypothetical protein
LSCVKNPEDSKEIEYVVDNAGNETDEMDTKK